MMEAVYVKAQGLAHEEICRLTAICINRPVKPASDRQVRTSGAFDSQLPGLRGMSSSNSVRYACGCVEHDPIPLSAESRPDYAKTR
jgi:hypothetical protein